MLWIHLFVVDKLTYYMPIFGQFLEGAPIYTTITGAYSFVAFYLMFFDTMLQITLYQRGAKCRHSKIVHAYHITTFAH